MGKKNKYRDMWDLTPEEQQEGLEEFAAFEKGLGDISSISNREPELDESGLTTELASLIASDVLSGRTKSSDPNRLEPVKEVKTESVTLTAVTHKEETAVTKSVNNNTKRDGVIKIIYKNLIPINRIIVDDGIAPCGVSLTVSSSLNMEDFNVDDCTKRYEYDDFEEFIRNFIVYTISLKHPTAIYTVDEFYSPKYLFNNCLNKFNKDKFIFITVDNWILAYEVDNSSFKDLFTNMYNHYDEEEYAIIETTRQAVALAIAVSSLNQAFFIEEDYYIEALYKSDLNMKEEFSKHFINDTNTELTDDPDEELTGFDMYDAKSLQTSVRDMISIITGEDYYDDDDEEDDEDDEEYENLIVNYPKDQLPDTVVISDKAAKSITSVVSNPVKVTVTEEVKTNKVSVVEAEKNLSDIMNTVNAGVNELLNDTTDSNDLLNDEMQIVETKETTAIEAKIESAVDRVPANNDDDDWTIPVIGKGK